MSDYALNLTGIVRTFHTGGGDLKILRGADVSLQAGEIVALLGPSGVGKSTLLHIAGLLERADAGEVHLGDAACSHLSDRDRTALRRNKIGFVYQFHNLLPEFSALDNVAMPQMILGIARRRARDRAGELLGNLGLSDRLDHQPSQLSGGEQQRVALARALANRPKVLLADEPTGNLDEATADSVFAELIKATQDEGVAALVATHNPALASRMDRRILLHNGLIEAG